MSKYPFPAGAAHACAWTVCALGLCGATARAQADVLRTWVAPPGTTLDHEPFPYPPYYDYTTIAAIPDLNGDGVPEILVGDSAFVGPNGEKGALFVLSGADTGPGQPATILRTHLGLYINDYTAPRSVGDVDGDGVADYSINGRTFRGRDGTVLFSTGILPLGDLDGDGLAEFVDGDQVRSGGSFEVRYPMRVRPGIVIDLGGDVDRDGVRDFFFQNASINSYHCQGSSSRYGVFSGGDGRILREELVYGCQEPVPFSSPGDLNGDGVGDLLRGGIFDGVTGDFFANLPLPESEVRAGIGSSRDAPGDLDGDGVADILAQQSEDDGERRERSLVAIDGRRLRPLWKLEGLTEYSLPSAQGFDWNDDGFPDFLRGEEVDEETWTISLHSGAPARFGSGAERSGVRGSGTPCARFPSAVARIGIAGTPWIGQTVELHLSGVAPGTGAFLLLGERADGGHQGPPCAPSVLAREIRAVKAVEITAGRGLASSELAIPPALELVGTTLHAQWLVGSFAKPHAITRVLELEFGIGPRHPSTVVGRVVLADGTPLADAAVELLGRELLTTSAPDGRFALSGIVTTWGGLRLLAVAEIDGARWSRVVGPLDPVPGRTMELGDVVLTREGKVLVLTPYPWYYGPSPVRDPLLQLGMPRENLVELRSLPQTLSAFDAIWHVGHEASAEADQIRLAEYVQAGGSLLVNGFLPELLSRVLPQGAPTVTTFQSGYPFLFREPSPDGISFLPNALTSLLFQSVPQAILGVADRNVLVRAATGHTVGAAWSRSDLVGGRGHLVFIAGSSWIYQRLSRNPLEVYENLHAYLLQGAPAAARGTVRFSNGMPASHARLRLAPLGSETFADARGNFLFPDVTSRLAEAEVEATARRKDVVQSGAATVTLVPGTTGQVDVVLRSTFQVLVFGDALPERQALTRDLASILPPGARIDSQSTLPPDLGPYDTIWHVADRFPLTFMRTRLANYVRAGGALHLSAETRGSNDGLAESIFTLLELLLPGRTWTVDPLDGPGPHRFERTVKRSATRLPNDLATWTPDGAARILGLRPSEILVRDGSGAPCGAIWDERDLAGGRGRVTLLMDAGWLDQPWPGRLETIENLQRFLTPSAGSLPRR